MHSKHRAAYTSNTRVSSARNTEPEGHLDSDFHLDNDVGTHDSKRRTRCVPSSDTKNCLTVAGAGSDPYCKYDSQVLEWFTSSLFIAGVFAALPAGYTTR